MLDMKIFQCYGHDSKVQLVEKIKEYLSKDAEGSLKHEVWIDTSEISILSHGYCVVSHAECNENRGQHIILKECGFMTDSKIKRIEYLDPFEKYFANK